MNKNTKTDPITLRCVSGKPILVFIILISAISAVKAEWQIEPALKVGVEKDDNPALSSRTDDVLKDTGLLYDVSARFDYQSPLTKFYVAPRLLSRNYSDHPDELDSDDWYLKSSFSHDTKSSTLRIRLNYTEQSVRQAERSDADLDVDNPDEIPDDDTGLVRLRGDREKWRISPQWSYRFSDISSFGIAFDYVDVSYSEAFQLLLTDYTDARLSLSLERAFSERTSGFLTATGRRYEPADLTSEVTGYGLMAGFERSLSEAATARVFIGVEESQTTTSDNDPNFVANISLRRRLETIDLLAQYRRTMNASGSGRVSARDAINLNLSRRLNEKITAGLGVRAYQEGDVNDSVSTSERDYVQLRAQFIWHISAVFATEVNYRYTFQKRSALTESANSNQVILWFIYQPNSIDRRFR